MQSMFAQSSAMNIGRTGSSSSYSHHPAAAKSTYTPTASSWNATAYMPPVVPSIPTLSDMKFSSLPFFEEIGCVLKPSNLAPSSSINYNRGQFQEKSFPFHLKVSEANSIGMSRVLSPNLNPTAQNPGPKIEFGCQILVRFALTCLSGPPENPSGITEDCLPPQLCLKVNQKMCQLPSNIPGPKSAGQNQTKTSRPIEITSLAKISPTGLWNFCWPDLMIFPSKAENQITITWNQPALSSGSSSIDYTKIYVVSIIIGEKLTADTLVSKIKGKGIKCREFTTALVKDKLAADKDEEITTTSLRASLLCPVSISANVEHFKSNSCLIQLGKMRIRTPGRSTSCTHIQCFDILLFLQMNEKKPSWICPSMFLMEFNELSLMNLSLVCDKKISFETLVVDGFFTDILATSESEKSTEIAFIEKPSESQGGNSTVEWQPIVKEDKKPCIASLCGTSSPVASQAKRPAEDDSSGQAAKKAKEDPPCYDISSDSDDEDSGQTPSGYAAYSTNSNRISKTSLPSSSSSTAVSQNRRDSSLADPNSISDNFIEMYNLSDEEDLLFTEPFPTTSANQSQSAASGPVSTIPPLNNGISSSAISFPPVPSAATGPYMMSGTNHSCVAASLASLTSEHSVMSHIESARDSYPSIPSLSNYDPAHNSSSHPTPPTLLHPAASSPSAAALYSSHLTNRDTLIINRLHLPGGHSAHVSSPSIPSSSQVNFYPLPTGEYDDDDVIALSP